ncbi:hypothetical protein RMN57_23475 [Kitasatospora sp. CM 4170]|uniref:Uncharacterized protein n=1 Tax=Kitasatospora aburaviensis TaxID=67265 RepID=A0ABW1EWI7_9ACTN|nr:hypothetical protein [Kitasatospora sp. CM 4170]WNM47447.1 hypothetical protein RMN57_23475 [Kitasatospora sp. CM 4170]
MPETASLVEAVDSLADRYRSMPQSRLLGAVPGHPSRAAAALALARWLAAAAQSAEGGPVREFPDAGAFVVGDQLAVAGHDLAAALAALPAEAPVPLPEPLGGPAPAAAVLTAALAEVAATTTLCA